MEIGELLIYQYAPTGDIVGVLTQQHTLKGIVSAFLLKQNYGFTPKEEQIYPLPINRDALLNFGFEKESDCVVNEFEWYERYLIRNAVEGTMTFEVHIIYSNYGNKEQTDICYAVNGDRQYVNNTTYAHDLQLAYKFITGKYLKFNIKK